MGREPFQVGFAGVRFVIVGGSVSEMILCDEGFRECEEPTVVVQGCPDPDGAGMVPVRGLVAAAAAAGQRSRLEEVVGTPGCCYMPGRPQQLRRFEDHLDDVAVAVPLGGLRRIEREHEDIHLSSIASCLLPLASCLWRPPAWFTRESLFRRPQENGVESAENG